jgi:hypothetical protein
VVQSGRPVSGDYPVRNALAECWGQLTLVDAKARAPSAGFHSIPAILASDFLKPKRLQSSLDLRASPKATEPASLIIMGV